MIPIHFVSDGPRDEVVLVPLVERILKRSLRPVFKAWTSLRLAGGGYKRKLLFALIQANDAGAEGLIATVDADRDGSDRLEPLRAAREEHRQKNPPIPTAIGCASPHHEAWLMDDSEAVRKAFGISATHRLPSSKDPKTDLDALIQTWRIDSGPLDVLRELAKSVELSRCPHQRETGMKAFFEDVAQEFDGLMDR